MSVNSVVESFSLNFLTYFANMSSYFSMKKKKNKKKQKVRNALNVSRNFCVNLLGKWEIFVNFPRSFWTVKVTHFAQVINFCKRVHRKVLSHKANRQKGKDRNRQINNTIKSKYISFEVTHPKIVLRHEK